MSLDSTFVCFVCLPVRFVLSVFLLALCFVSIFKLLSNWRFCVSLFLFSVSNIMFLFCFICFVLRFV